MGECRTFFHSFFSVSWRRQCRAGSSAGGAAVAAAGAGRGPRIPPARTLPAHPSRTTATSGRLLSCRFTVTSTIRDQTDYISPNDSQPNGINLSTFLIFSVFFLNSIFNFGLLVGRFTLSSYRFGVLFYCNII